MEKLCLVSMYSMLNSTSPVPESRAWRTPSVTSAVQGYMLWYEFRIRTLLLSPAAAPTQERSRMDVAVKTSLPSRRSAVFDIIILLE